MQTRETTITSGIDKEALVALNLKNTIVIDSNITPIYPVRYAYANFFDKEIAEPENPPDISTLMNAKSLAEGKGYVLRLLREGWVYIREEDNREDGYFHIFKYERVASGESVEEKFTKYLFKNKVNAQGGLVLDKSRGRSTYPFVFVRSGIQQVSIAYSEHEWSFDVIDRMNARADEREASMQKVNLRAEGEAHAVPADAGNFRCLIEDYQLRKDRKLALEKASVDQEVKEVTLDIITTVASYDLEADSIAAELQEKTDYGEKARIVALHDPVGRQKDIASAHGKLTLWEKNYSSTQVYPYTIGSIVKDFRGTEDEKVRKMVEEAINWREHNRYWGGHR